MLNITLKKLTISLLITVGASGLAFAEPLAPKTTEHAITKQAAAAQAPITTQQEQTALTRISINAADAATMAEHLVGIGPAKAEAIVSWRTTHGRFTEAEQLLQIKGIGQATLNKNKNRITL
ncbi:ComEA family DNA-binding protein [Marinagarivorans algicola]|uniref:ComEA family DNA-binding protein n=1 Tax=Marinagarivorans algicola TaxID=1513270 RepID=UPI0006B8DFB8|nr:helix-hairpin-helix domain-containing protein [Marinagarivorans algicola]